MREFSSLLLVSPERLRVLIAARNVTLLVSSDCSRKQAAVLGS
jgi:hypothetical protein